MLLKGQLQDRCHHAFQDQKLAPKLGNSRSGGIHQDWLQVPPEYGQVGVWEYRDGTVCLPVETRHVARCKFVSAVGMASWIKACSNARRQSGNGKSSFREPIREDCPPMQRSGITWISSLREVAKARLGMVIMDFVERNYCDL